MYFVCRLNAKTFDIKKQEDEIAECKWMKVEFLNLVMIKAEEYFGLGYQGVYKRLLDLQKANVLGTYEGFKKESLPIVFRSGENLVYHNKL